MSLKEKNTITSSVNKPGVCHLIVPSCCYIIIIILLFVVCCWQTAIWLLTVLYCSIYLSTTIYHQSIIYLFIYLLFLLPLCLRLCSCSVLFCFLLQRIEKRLDQKGAVKLHTDWGQTLLHGDFETLFVKKREFLTTGLQGCNFFGNYILSPSHQLSVFFCVGGRAVLAY